MEIPDRENLLSEVRVSDDALVASVQALQSQLHNAMYAKYRFPFTRSIQGLGSLSVRTRDIAKVRRYIAVLKPKPLVGEIEIAVSFDGEDWNTFFTRVLDILTKHDNDILRSYVVENREKLLYEAGVSNDAPLVASVPAPTSVRKQFRHQIWDKMAELISIINELAAVRRRLGTQCHT